MNRLTLLGMAFLYAVSVQATTLPYKDLIESWQNSISIVLNLVSVSPANGRRNIS